MSDIVHARGLGQVATVCQGGGAPLGPAVPYADETCVACRLRPVADAVTALGRGLAAVAQSARRAADALGSIFLAAEREKTR